MERTDAQETGIPCDDPYRPPVSLASNPDCEPKGQSDLRKLLRADELRALAWFLVMIVTLLFGSANRIGAVGPTAWSTWMSNWQSNLSFYFAGLCLVMCLIHFGRLLVLTYRRKRT